MHPAAEALLMARACARRGLDDAVNTLHDAVGDLARATEQIASGLYHHLCINFADPSMMREELLERHQCWLDSFPMNPLREQVANQAKRLKEVIASDKLCKEGTDAVENLVFALRDEFHPVNVLRDDGHFVPSTALKNPCGPCEQLRKLGIKAAPALVAAVGDETLTRCVWYSSRYGGSFWILSVGEFAEELLMQISGLEVYGAPDERKTQWRDWWEKAAENGEAASLSYLAASGTHTSVGAAKRLLERCPGHLEEVMKGARKTENTWVRRSLVKLLAEHKEESVAVFLLEELKESQDVPTRVVAARALLDRGSRYGLDIFAAAWATGLLPEETHPEVSPKVAEFDRASANQAAWASVTDFLLKSGDVAVVMSVGQDLLKRPSSIRRVVLDTLRHSELQEFVERAAKSARETIEKSVEKALVELLEDTDCHVGTSYSFNYRGAWISLQDPRTCDLAACSLSSYWPCRYDFDPIRPPRGRDRQNVSLRNLWRKGQGIPLLDVPAVPDVRSHDPEVKASVDLILASGEERIRKTEAARLEKAGLGALPWVQDALRGLAKGHLARADLEELANRLATIVSCALFDSGTWEAPAALRTKVSELKGKRLDAEKIGELLRDSYQALAGSNGEIELVVDRDTGGIGIGLALRITNSGGTPGDGTAHRYCVNVGGKSLGNSGGAGTRDWIAEDDHKDEREAAEAALGARHCEVIEMLFWLELN